MAIALVAGLAGLLLSYPLIQRGLGRFVEENMGQMLPVFRISPETAVAALALAIGMGLVAGVVPAWRAARLPVTDVLRRVE